MLFSENIVLDNTQLKAAKHVFDVFGNMSVIMGLIGMIVGAIAMSSSIDSEDLSKVFGPALAVCLLTLFYASLIKALCYAAGSKIQFKIISQG